MRRVDPGLCLSRCNFASFAKLFNDRRTASAESMHPLKVVYSERGMSERVLLLFVIPFRRKFSEFVEDVTGVFAYKRYVTETTHNGRLGGLYCVALTTVVQCGSSATQEY